MHVQIQFTIDDTERAESIITTLLDRRLIACAQRLGPVASRYWWQGSQEEATEWLFLLKTKDELVADVIQTVTDLHPYETPEIVALAIQAGSTAYLGWVDAVTR